MGAKTLLFGFDGLEPTRLDALIAEGVLPNFQKLRDQSRRTDIGIYPGFGAGAFWASGATGVSPAQHGRYFFLQFDKKTYDAPPFHEYSAYRTPPFWEKLDRDRKKVFVADWHRGPFSEMKNGVLVDNWLGHDAPTPIETSPPELAAEILEKYGSDPIAGGFAHYGFSSLDDHRRFVDDSMKRISAKVNFCVDMLKKEDWDLFIPCFTELHDLGHYYMHLAAPEHELFDEEALHVVGEPLRRTYLALDIALAALREAAGEDAVVMMLAGPGMEPTVSANRAMDEIALKLDLGATPPVTPGATARAAYRKHFSGAFRQRFAKFARKARQILADNDYKRRRFFAVPHNENAGCIRVNVKGRERYGVVSPGAEYEMVLEEIKAGLLSLKNAETGAPAVSDVYFTHHELKGPFVDDLPDVFAVWNRIDNPRTFNVLTSERTGDIIVPRGMRTGDHTRNSCFWSTGADAEVFAPSNKERMPHETVAAVIESLEAPLNS